MCPGHDITVKTRFRVCVRRLKTAASQTPVLHAQEHELANAYFTDISDCLTLKELLSDVSDLWWEHRKDFRFGSSLNSSCASFLRLLLTLAWTLLAPPRCSTPVDHMNLSICTQHWNPEGRCFTTFKLQSQRSIYCQVNLHIRKICRGFWCISIDKHKTPTHIRNDKEQVLQVIYIYI